MTAVLDARPVGDVEPHDPAEPPVSMVERMTLILSLFKRPQTRLTLERIVVDTCLPRSTAHRILEQLAQSNWVAHSSSGYHLGPRALSLGGRDVGFEPLRSAAAPRLHDLALRTGLVAHLVVLDAVDIVYLDKVGGREATDMRSRVGGRAPAHRTASGRAILASMPPERVDAVFASATDFDVRQQRVDMARLHRELNVVRQHSGVAVVENFAGTSSVAVPIRGVDGPLGAVSLTGLPERPLDRVVPLLVSSVRTIATEILAAGWQLPSA